MAWRIHEHVLRGEIDNRTRGRVIGRVWLAGIEAPLVLELSGDCHPDLAGCRLDFENPTAIPMTTKPPAFRQRGPVGEITAARKVRVFDIPIPDTLAMRKCGETPSEHMVNSFYMEWFSDLGGHVIIESSDYHLQISEPLWRFTAAEIAEAERRTATGNTTFAAVMDADGLIEQWDEVRYEQFLRESDAITDRYSRLLEKYGDDLEAERLIAREMGWKWFEESLAEEKAQPALGEKEAELRDQSQEPAMIRKPRPIPCAKASIGCATTKIGSVIPSRSVPISRYTHFLMSLKPPDIFLIRMTRI